MNQYFWSITDWVVQLARGIFGISADETSTKSKVMDFLLFGTILCGIYSKR